MHFRTVAAFSEALESEFNLLIEVGPELLLNLEAPEAHRDFHEPQEWGQEEAFDGCEPKVLKPLTHTQGDLNTVRVARDRHGESSILRQELAKDPFLPCLDDDSLRVVPTLGLVPVVLEERLGRCRKLVQVEAFAYVFPGDGLRGDVPLLNEGSVRLLRGHRGLWPDTRRDRRGRLGRRQLSRGSGTGIPMEPD